MLPILLAFAAACSGDSSRTPTAPSGSTFGVDGARAATVPTNECAAAGTGWIFCDDFETDRLSSYYTYDNAGGRFVRAATTGMGGSVGMRATYLQGPSAAGSLRLAFGSVPSTTFRPVDAGTAKYREVYWRFYSRREAGWKGASAGNLTRATVLATSSRSQAMSAYAWSAETPGYLLLDPTSGTTTTGTLITTAEDDYAHMRWLGPAQSAVAVEDQAHVGQWSCYEFHVKLNTAGQSDGVFELTVDGQPSARKAGLNWLGSYNAYGINAVNLDQYTYDALAAGNARTLDNFIVSTAPIGCGVVSTPPPAPVASVAVTPAAPTGYVGQTVQLVATTKDASGNALTGRTIVWASADTSRATVGTTGLVTMKSVGTTTVFATSEGVTGNASVTISVPPVATVTVTPATSSGNVGQTVQLSATTKDSSGTVVTGRAINWASNSATVATVSSSGLVTMTGAGTALISAMSEGKSASATVTVTAATSTGPNECATPSASWIFCDDFESDRTAKYFEYNNAGGKFARTSGTGFGGSVGMRATYTIGQTGAGSLALAFGRTPSSYFRPADAGTANYREVYWRVYVRREVGWVGNGAMKLTRATVFAKADWSQAMIAHGWTSSSDDRYLMIDPARGTDASGNLITVGYNDFTHLTWLGGMNSAAPEEDQAHVGQWACYEYHVKLNDAGQSNGVFEFRVNGQMSAQKTGLNFLGAYNAYGINALFLENFFNAGAPAANKRTLDNFVVSTQPIGCVGAGGGVVPPPADVTRPSVSITAPQASGIYTTTASQISMSGVASDNVGVTQVRWSSDRGASGTFTGTSSWSASAIPLQTGTNIVTVTAQDAANNVATTTLTVARTVTTAVATKLALTTQPSSSAQPGVVFSQQPIVQLRDASNIAVAQSGVVVTAAIASGGGTLGGTVTATTDATGLARFTNLSITGVDGARTLSFSAPSLTAVQSNAVTVTAPVTPPVSGSGSCPNEPTSYARINEQPWDQVPVHPLLSLGWIDDYWNAGSAIPVVSDPTSPFPSSNHNVAAGTFKQGSPGGSSPFFIYRPFTPTEQFKNIYICLYLKHSADFDNTNGNTGTKFLWPAADQIQGTQTYNGHDGANMDFQFFQQGAVDRRLGANVNASAAQMYGKRGQWVRYEMLLKASSSNSTANGGLDVWIDGVQTHHYTNVQWQMSGARTWMSLGWNPTYGGGFNPVPRTQYQYMDNIRISGSNQ